MNATQMRIMGCTTKAACDEMEEEINGPAFRGCSQPGRAKLLASVAQRRKQIAGRKKVSQIPPPEERAGLRLAVSRRSKLHKQRK